MAAAGDSPWLSRGVPVLLLLSIGFTCYFWYWHAEKYRDIVSKSLLGGAEAIRRSSGAQSMETDGKCGMDGRTRHWLCSTVRHSPSRGDCRGPPCGYQRFLPWGHVLALGKSLPLFMLAGHDIDPQSGRIGIALCFLGIALWLSVPSHSLLGGVSSDGR
ncbi:hypothetical protein J3E72DRAFT_273556 [Bipolaris maydis]|nr:hypothetical protein J3E72DRAFT_273556 [Bipolaris maydis]